MDLRRACCALVYVVLLWALAAWSTSERSRWWPVDLFQNHGDDIQWLPEMKEQVQSHNREALVNRKNAEDFKSCIPEKRLLKCAETIFGKFIASRRFLVGKSQGLVVLRAYPLQAPVPAQAPGPSIYGPVPAGYGPAPQKASPPPTPSISPEHTDSIQKQQIIAATIAAGAALLLVVLLCFWCVKGKRNKIDPKEGQQDDHPLLNLIPTNFSAGSSHESFNLENKEVGVDSGELPHLAINFYKKREVDDNALADESSLEAIGPTLSLKPPSGRLTSPPLERQVPPPPPPSAPPRPPQPPKLAQPPPLPKEGPGGDQLSPLGPNRSGKSGLSVGGQKDGYSEGHKAKLKPFFWDKVLANPDQSMVWHEIRAGSFQFDEEMIESLFGYSNMSRNRNENRRESVEPSVQCIRIIDPRKAQNLSILLKALDVTTDEIVDALREGNELPVGLLQTLLKMAPTTDEELKLRLFAGDHKLLGPAERFLKVLVDIPLAFKRLESIHYMTTFQEEVSSIKESFATLEVACKKLKESRLFLKLLEAVLKTGNRMNDGTYRGGAQAFRLDTLLKLADVKGTNGKTTLLHFVVQEIIRSEGRRALRRAKASQSLSNVATEDLVGDSNEELGEQYYSVGLQVVSGLSNELEDVKKAAVIDADVLTTTVLKLGQSLTKVKDFLNSELKNLNEDHKFQNTVAGFVDHSEADGTWLLEEERRISALIRSTADYFHGHAGREEGLRLFMIVRDFLLILDKVCKEVKNSTTETRVSKNKSPSHAPTSSSPDIHQTASDLRQRTAIPSNPAAENG